MPKVLLILKPEEYRRLAELAQVGDRPVDHEARRLLRLALEDQLEDVKNLEVPPCTQ